MRIVVSKRLVIVVYFRHIRVGKNVEELGGTATGFKLQLAILELPATVPYILILPLFGITHARLRFHVVKPGVFHAFSVSPHVLAGNRAGVTADAFVQVKDKGELCAYFHDVLLMS